MAQIGIAVDFNDAQAGSRIDQLKAKLTGLQAEQTRLNATAFNAFSRAQIQPQIDILEKLQYQIRNTYAEAIKSAYTRPPNIDLRSQINSIVGLNEVAKSAQNSARTLSRSLYDLAIGDATARDSAIKNQQAQLAAGAAATQRAAETKAAIAASSTAMDAEYARPEARYAGRTSRALPQANQIQGPGISSNPEAEIERLSKEIIQKGQLLATTVGQSMQIEAVKGLEQAVTKARNRIAELNAGGAQASGAAYQQFSQSETAAARAQLNANLVKDAGALFAEIKKTEAALKMAGSAATGVTNNLRGATREVTATEKVLQHFPALFDTIAAGRSRQMLASLGATLRDSGAGTTGILAGLGGIAAFGAIEAGIRTLKEWNTQITEIAQKQTNFAATVGMSAGEFSNFSAAMKLVGGNADSAAHSLDLIQRRMEEAVQSPTSGPATAFLKLGFDWDELKKKLQDPSGITDVLRQLAGEYVRLGDTAERTAIFMQLLGGRQGLTQLAPLLRGGRTEFDAIMQSAKESNTHLAGNIDQLNKMAEKIDKLATNWENFKARVTSGDLFAGPTESLNKFLENLNKSPKAMEGLSDMIKTFVWPLGLFDVMQKESKARAAKAASGEATAPIPAATAPIMTTGGAIGNVVDPMNKLATVSSTLAKTFEATAAATGYKVGVTGGHAESGHVRDSQHYTELGAIDFNIYDKSGAIFDHKSAQKAGSAGWQAYVDFGEKFKQLSPGAGRSGMDFNDPGHVDLGLLNGAEPGKLAGQLTGQMQSGMALSGKTGADLPQTAPAGARIDSQGDLGTDEKLYMARLKYSQLIATNLNQQGKLNALLAEAEAYEKMPQKQKDDFLLSQVNLTKQQAEGQIKLLEIDTQIENVKKNQTMEAQKIALANNQTAEISARGREDAKALVDLEAQRAKIISSNQYNDEATRIEARNQVLQAGINLEKQNLSILEKVISTQEQISNSVIKQSEAANAAGQGGKKDGSHATAYAADIAVVKEQYQIQVDLIKQEIALAQAKKDTTAETSAQLKLLTTIENEQTRIVEIQKKMADEVKAANDKAIAPLKSFFSSAGSAFEGFLDAAIGKTETFSKAIQKLGTGLIKDAVKGIGNVGSEAIAGQFGGKAGEGISGLLADKLGSLVGLTKTVPKATGDAALATSATSVTTSLQALNSAILQTAGAMTTHSAATTGNTTAQTISTTAKTTDTGAQVLNTTGKATNSLAMTADSTAVQANAVAQSAAAASSGGSAAVSGIGGFLKAIPMIGSLFLQRGGIIPSAAGGMITSGALAGGGQLSILHPNEMVLPSPISSGLQNMISQNGGGGNNFSPSFAYNANMTGYHPYNTRSDFEGALRQHGGTILNHVTNLMRNGWRP